MSTLIGTTLEERYTITQRLATGGMADLFLAEETLLKREVVVKVMRRELLQNPAFADRFRREALATARLQHPNVISIYSTGALTDGRLYLVMQHVTGGSLRDMLESLQQENLLLSTPAALFLARQIAEALHLAHAHDIIHRDLKPGNILLTKSGTPIVTDLGIAAMPDGDTRLTQTGALLGTPTYMPPEQVNMVAERPVDGRSDIYALGIILYEMLTGEPPFRGPTATVMYQQVHNTPPPLQKIRPDLPPALCSLVHRCLEKEPDKRWQSAAALTAALDELLLGMTQAAAAQASDTGKQRLLAERLPRAELVRPYTTPPPRRVPAWLWAAVAVLLSAVALTAAGLLWMRPGPDAPLPPATRTAADPPPTNAAPTAAPIVVAIVTATGAPTLIAPSATPSLTPPPTETAVPPSPTPVRIPRPDQIVFMSNQDGDMEIYVVTIDGQNQRALTNNDADDRFPAVSPDGSRILFESDRNGNWDIFVMNIDGSDVQQLTSSAQDELRPTWSPDGRQIAYLGGDPLNIFLMERDGRFARQITMRDDQIGSVSWSVNDELVFQAGAVATSWELYKTTLSGAATTQLTDNGASDWSPEWSPDGSRIVYMSALDSGEPAIFMMDADGGNPRMIFNSPEYEWSPHWTPDGEQILFTKDVDGVNASAPFIINADGSGERQVAARGAFPFWSQAYTPPAGAAAGGSEPESAIYPLAYQCGAAGARQITLADPDGFWTRPLPNQLPDSIIPAFSRDGTRIVYRAIVNGFWQIFSANLNGSDRQQLTTPEQGNNYEAVWSPDNSQLVFISDRTGSRQLFVMDSNGGNPQQINSLNGYVDDPSWSEDNVLAFEYDGDGRFNIYTLSPSGGAMAALLSLGSASSTPAWSPDGERIAFEVAEEGVRHIWIANKDGSNPTQITVNGSSNQRPAWSPDGRRLAFQSNYQQPLPNQYDIWIIDIETQRAARRTFSGDCLNAAWSWTAVSVTPNP